MGQPEDAIVRDCQPGRRPSTATTPASAPSANAPSRPSRPGKSWSSSDAVPAAPPHSCKPSSSYTASKPTATHDEKGSVFDPFAELPANTDGIAERLLEQLGWEEGFGIGNEATFQRIRSYRRAVDRTEEHMIEVVDVLGASPYLRGDSFVELMHMTARWAPAVQAAAVVDLIDEMRSFSLGDDNTIGRIAAHVVDGIEKTLPSMRDNARQQASHERRVREARKAAAKEQS